MNKETARLLFMDYLYDELEPQKRKELELFLENHPELRTELEELSGVRSMLSHLPVQNPEEQLVMMEPQKASFFTWWQQAREVLMPRSIPAKVSLALAAGLLLFVFTGALTRMNISIQEGTFSLAFGETQVTQGYSPEQVDYIVTQLKEENALLVSQIVEQAQEQQEQKIEETLIDFANYMEEQRTSDLRLISTGLTSLEETYYDRFRQTDQVLGEIIQTVSQTN